MEEGERNDASSLPWEEAGSGEGPSTSFGNDRRGILSQIMRRQCHSAPSGSAVNVVRAMCTSVVPCNCVASTKPAECHIRGFTPNGRYLVCFSTDLKSLLLYNFTGFQGGNQADASRAKDSVTFESFFSLAAAVEIAPGTEQLCKSFCISAANSKLLILASATLMQQPSTQAMPISESITFHVVDLDLRCKTDECTFAKDFILLSENNGVSIYDDVFCVLSIKNQCVHLFHLSRDGKLLKIRTVGDFVFEDDELELRRHNYLEAQFRARHKALKEKNDDVDMRDNAGSPVANGNEGDDIFSGITQRLLGFLAKKALHETGHDKHGRNERLKQFYFHFQDYQNLIMWKMQLLDRNHLLIKFDKRQSVWNAETSSGRYSGVFHLTKGCFVCFFMNSSEALAYLYQNFTDHFKVMSGDHMWSRYISSYANDQFLRAQLDKQRGRYNKVYGSEFELAHQISSFLPLSPKMTNSSPYLDMRLFQFDDRFVSPYSCPRPLADHSIKWLARGAGFLSTRFKCNPMGGEDEEAGGGEFYCCWVFHPTFPFIMSCVHAQVTHAPKLLKFYYRF